MTRSRPGSERPRSSRNARASSAEPAPPSRPRWGPRSGTGRSPAASAKAASPERLEVRRRRPGSGPRPGSRRGAPASRRGTRSFAAAGGPPPAGPARAAAARSRGPPSSSGRRACSATSSALLAFLMLASRRSRRFSTVARGRPGSARGRASSASRSGSTEPSGWGTMSDSKARTTCTRASMPRSAGRSTRADPSPLATPGTSTYSTVAWVFFLGLYIAARRLDPRVGDAGDPEARPRAFRPGARPAAPVRSWKRVLLPTDARPMMATFMGRGL